ncbi:Uncharacterised protein [BD1-7 clade bacterium]|uniref:Coenzyme Q-binding protein COQ10 START domain-containing protein n=1 Tax=BD1-7 clade bacterium TaxID=2029982 RepID=A0A5S9PI38_9GAMM|nr:Uncharacterised protein [BD1-7 clade bacterium]
MTTPKVATTAVASSNISSSLSDDYQSNSPTRLKGLFSDIICAEPINISAPADEVWRHITNFEDYPNWNPLNRFFELDTHAGVGESVTFGVSWGPYEDGGTPRPLDMLKQHLLQHETFTTWHTRRAIAYADTIFGLLRAERVQVLTPIDDNNTQYHTFERCQGVLQPLVLFLYKKKIIRGFNAASKALKMKAESNQGVQH